MEENENDWETLCKECSEAAEKAGITKEDTDRIIKEVREKIRQYEETGIMDIEMQRLEETFNLVYEITKIKAKLKAFNKKLQAKVDRSQRKTDSMVEIQEDPSIVFNYYGGWSKGYYQGRLAALEDIQDEFNALFSNKEVSNDSK